MRLRLGLGPVMGPVLGPLGAALLLAVALPVADGSGWLAGVRTAFSPDRAGGPQGGAEAAGR